MRYYQKAAGLLYLAVLHVYIGTSNLIPIRITQDIEFVKNEVVMVSGDTFYLDPMGMELELPENRKDISHKLYAPAGQIQSDASGEAMHIDTSGLYILQSTFPDNIVLEDTFLVLSAPILQDDYTQVLEDVSVRIPVLANDFAPDDSILKSTLVSSPDFEPTSGTIRIDTMAGIITYTPDEHFFGLDSFRYTVCNRSLICTDATVFIRVHPVNDAPVLQNDVDSVQEDGLVYIDVMENDQDDQDNMELDFSSLSIQGARKPNHGTIQLDSITHKIIYRPDLNYFGYDYFEYHVCDQGYPLPARCDTAAVHVKVVPENDPPIILNDQELTYAGLLVVVDVLENDSDSIDEILTLDLTTLSTEGLSQPNHGTVFVDQQVGMIVYLPESRYVGMDTFTYKVCDLGPDPVLCDTALVIIEILPAFQNRSSFLSKPGKLNLKTNETISVYPNPTHRYIQIQGTNHPWENIQIFNATGILTYSKTFAHVDEVFLPIDIMAFPAGSYFIRVANGQQSKTIPFYKL